MKISSKIGLLLSLLIPACAYANQKFTGVCSQSGRVVVSGLNSTNNAALTYAGATVTVNVVGGGLATIFSDNVGTPLSNPFTAGSDATFGFYAANGRYTVVCSGTGIPSITVNGDALLNDPAAAGSTFTGSSVTSSTANPATTGFIRQASTDSMCWRNNANSANLCLSRSGAGDTLTWPSALTLTGGFTATTGTFSGAITGTTESLSGGLTAATVNSSGGLIDNTPIGSITPSTGSFTTGAFSGALTGLGATFSAEVGPNVSGVPLGDTAHRWDTFIRNLDVSGTITGILNGSGTTNTLPKFTAATVIGNSSVTDDGTTVSTTEGMSIGGALTVSGVGGINAGSNPLVAGATTLNRIKNVCNVPSTAYTTIGAAYADSTNCGAVYVWPNSASGYTETLSANLVLNRSSVPIVFMGPATISMGTNQITAAGTVNGVSIIGMCGLSSGGNQCAKFVYTGTSAAIAIGDSSTHSKSLLLRGIWVSTSGNGAVGLQINNLDQFSVEDSYFSQDGGTAPISIQTVGTGTFIGSGSFINDHIVGAATNGIGYQFKTLSTNMQIIGGNVALDVGASAVCIDIQGASTQSIEPDNVNLNTCNTAVKVENTATSTGAIVGSIRTDSGVTTVASYAAGTFGNKLTCVDCATNAAVSDSGSSNSVEVILQNQINSRFNAIVSSSGGYSISEPTPNKSWLVHSTGGDTSLDALGVGGTVHIGHSAGGTGGLSVENGTGTAGATISGTGAAVFNASIQVNGGTVFTGSVGSGTKIASNSAVQTFEYGCTGTATSATTIILNNTLTAPACTGTSASRPLTKISSAGTITNLAVGCTTGGVNASSGVVTVRRNGSTSVLTCTLGTGTTCSDTTHSFAVGAGDELNLQFTTQSAETLANCEFSFEKQ